MPLMPVLVDGKIRLQNLPLDSGAYEQQCVTEESRRTRDVYLRRLYFAGQQYERRNWEAFRALNLNQDWQTLPEHDRLHAYATQISECVEFITDQLAEGFNVTATDPTVGEVLAGVIAATDTLSGDAFDDMDGPDASDEAAAGDGEDTTDPNITIDEVLRDSLIAGDVAAEVLWDPIEGTCYLEFWESEKVEVRFASRTRVEAVIREELRWVVDERSVDSSRKQVVERVVYTVEVHPDHGHPECCKQTYWDTEEAPVRVEWLGFPVLPWALLRADSRRLRGTRGESLITMQAMETAMRYDAVEQLSWLIARYNSHGNLAVVGDQAMLKVENDPRVAKDVADVLTFPGGTNLTSIQLPTDPRMIEHQKEVLAAHLYAIFGLVQLDTASLHGMGRISGYALEILNRKTSGTFRRIRRNFISDIRALFNLTLDVTAYRQGAAAPGFDTPLEELTGVDLISDEVLLPEGAVPDVPFWDIDPGEVFPDRRMQIEMGTGYIVDDVLLRDDWVARVISREEVLRKRGYTKAQIAQIIGELEKTPGGMVSEDAVFGANTVSLPTPAHTQGTQAGSTVGSTITKADR